MKKTILILAISAICTQAFSQSWNLTGNAGTNTSANFIGTTDNKALKFRTNNAVRMTMTTGGKIGIGTSSPVFKLDVKSGSINTDSVYRIRGNAVLSAEGSGNIFVGSGSGIANTIGYNNSAIGVNALRSNTEGFENTALGHHAMYWNTTGAINCATGQAALFSNTSGSGNVASGLYALFYNTTGNNNTATGRETLLRNVAGNNSVAIGGYSQENTNNQSTSWDNTNTSVGYQSLRGSTIWSSNTGLNNTAIGRDALFSNRTGTDNTALGYQPLYYNTTGNSNVALGANALYSNVAGNGATAVGTNAMYYTNSTSTAFINYNVAVGYHALRGSTTASANTGNFNNALGYETLWNNAAGGSNNAFGSQTLYNNTTGSNNAGFGAAALFSTTTGNHNTGVGRWAYYADGTLSNTTCIGYNSGIIDGSNRIELGNTSVSVIAGQVGFSTYSDARIKDNVKQDVPGLTFINKLQPVTYHLNIHRQNEMVYTGIKKDVEDWDGKYDIEKIKMTGFLAQDVEKAAIESGYDFSGVQKPANPDGLYSLRYSDFVMPLVKAVQELDKDNAELKMQNAELIKRIEALEQKYGNDNKAQEVQLNNVATSLEQNQPNPFHAQTTIRYAVTTQFGSAGIQISDNSNRVLKTVVIKQTGKGEFIIHASELGAGAYQYSLIVDGKVVDTKHMVLTK